MSKNEKKKKFKIMDIVKNKQYYAIANLVFYFCLILVLIISVRMNPSTSENNNSSSNNNIKDVQTTVDGYSNIKNRNFNFKYTLSLDDVKKEYEGKQRENKILFTDRANKKEYFLQDNIVLVKDKDQFILSESPVEYFNYFDVDIIEKILSESTKKDDEYIISIQDFEKIISSKIINEEGEIYIEILKTNGIITKISFDLTEYINIKNPDIEMATLDLEYSNFNLIETFDIQK